MMKISIDLCHCNYPLKLLAVVNYSSLQDLSGSILTESVLCYKIDLVRNSLQFGKKPLR